MEIKGTVKNILPEVKGVSQKGEWCKNQVVLEVASGEYSDLVHLTDFKGVLKPLNVGDEVTVGINIKSREYNGNWYTDVSAWKIELHGVKKPEPIPEPRIDMPGDDSDLPF